MTTNNKINVKARRSEINKIECFIEEICDQYNIFNSYFSNILISVVECFEIVIEYIDRFESKEFDVDIIFRSGKNGLFFVVQSPVEMFDNQMFKDIFDEEAESFSRKGLIIRYLSDQVDVCDEGKSCQIVFFISSINYDKTNERNNLLNDYFNKISIKNRV